MQLNYLDIDASQLNEIQSFDWMVRSLSQGYRTGKKLSRKLGAGMEFSQYRPYSQGDDLRRLDWKMYARSDRYYIKESEIETQLEVTFILDHSQSMAYAEGGHSKWQFAKLLTGILSYFSLLEGDSIGLAVGPKHLHNQQERSWKRFLFELSQQKTSTNFIPPAIINQHKKELFVVLTDHYDESGDIPNFVTQLKTGINEVVILHLMGAKERLLNFNYGDRFKDLETQEQITFDNSYQVTYREKINQWISDLNQQYLDKSIDYLPIDFTDPFAKAIEQIQQQRKKLL